MILWDVLTKEEWGELQRSGVLRDLSDARDLDPADPRYSQMLAPHEWFREQVAQRIGPPPEGVSFPTELYGLEKPDMRSTCFEYMGDEVVRLRIEVPDDRLVLFDDGGWCLALMLSPFFWTEADYDAFDAEIAAKGYDFDDRWDSENTELMAMIVQTWERIFDVETAWGDVYVPPCAAVWELRLDWIKSAEVFKTRKSSGGKDVSTSGGGPSAVEVAERFMEDYSDVFEKLTEGTEN